MQHYYTAGQAAGSSHHPPHPPPAPWSAPSMPPPPPMFAAPVSDDSEPHQRGSTIPDPQSVVENGRTYQTYRDGQYWFPNDAQEQDRMDFTHSLFLRLLEGKLACAPIGEPADVLDIGTATGIWAIDFAKQHPRSRVIGSDLSLIQPLSHLPNCEFVRDDIEDLWVFDRHFDYIHLRLMVSSFKDPRAVMQTIFDNLKPGGWVEYQDTIFEAGAIDDTVKGTPFQDWLDRMQTGASNLGRDLNSAKKYRRWLIDTGFVDVEQKVILCPGNPWSSKPEDKEMGHYQAVASSIAVPAFSLRILQRGLGMNVDEINALVPQVQKNIRDTDIHWYAVYYIVYGRKPYEYEMKQAHP